MQKSCQVFGITEIISYITRLLLSSNKRIIGQYADYKHITLLSLTIVKSSTILPIHQVSALPTW